MIRILLAVAGIGAITCGAIAMGGPLVVFINAPSVVLVVGTTVIGSFLSYSPREVVSAFRQALGRSDTDTSETDSAMVLHRMADLAVASGLLGMLIGLVLMLQSLEDPTQIGPAMAVALLTTLYGTLLGEVFLRGLANSRFPAPTQAESPQQRRGAATLYAFISTLVGMLCFTVMMLAFCE